MGIERFHSRMQAAGFIQKDEMIGQRGDSIHTHAIVDGPAFAYFVHRHLKISKAQTVTRHAHVGSPVSYRECAAESIRWLHLLEEHGLATHAIYFDGALPIAKRPTRIKRLKQSAELLRNYKLRDENRQAKNRSGDLPEPNLQQTTLPEPPFLVPVVREALLKSQYQDRVFVVPGEADNFCVAAARQLNLQDASAKIIALSNDSDLAVFDSGPRTRILMLNSLEHTKEHVLKASSYWPSKIAKSIRQPNLLELAYYLQKDTHVSVTRIQARLDHDSTTTDRAYQDFKDQYSVEKEQSILKTLQNDPKKRLPLLGLDARLAELVCQVQHEGDASAELEVYLPFLIDDPTRASAWHVGTRLRDSAYAIVLAHHGQLEASVLEYKRAGDNIAARKVQSLDLTGLPSMFSALDVSLKHTLDEESALSSHERWRYAVVQILLWNLVELGQSLPHATDLLHVLLGRANTAWSNIRFTAQYEACFYSLRMLHQALRYAQHIGGDGFGKVLLDEHEEAGRLLGTLESLPSIADLLEPSTAEQADGAATYWSDLLSSCVREISGQTDEPVEPSRPSKKRRTKKSKGAAAAESQTHNTTLPSRNAFSMLDT